jgi:hypothetical protein
MSTMNRGFTEVLLEVLYAGGSTVAATRRGRWSGGGGVWRVRLGADLFLLDMLGREPISARS